MLRFQSFDIVFQEVPGEVTLALNIAHCPNRCPGCHSPHLQEDQGPILNEDTLSVLLTTYARSVTCVGFMGGDADPAAVERLARYVKRVTSPVLKTAWYSGRQHLPDACGLSSFDFIKLGPYVERLGGLTSPTTNQRFYRVQDGRLIDSTSSFQRFR
jgi:anaerobic ribonucleoside-triphosphate reductase activating protein